jgi:hypothetical protein
MRNQAAQCARVGSPCRATSSADVSTAAFPYSFPSTGSRLRLGRWIYAALLGVGCTHAPARPGPGAPSSSADVAAARLEAEPGTQSNSSEDSGVHEAASSSRERGARLASLSPRHVGAAVREQYEAFSACQALADIETLKRDGAVTVGWLVETDGSIKAVNVAATTFSSVRVNECVLGAARQVRFPATASRAEVTWTVNFRGAAGGPVAEAGRHLGSRH